MENRKLKILVVTYFPWCDSKSTGNTISNIFAGLEDRLQFASIYFQDDLPDNSFTEQYFHISERSLAKSIFTHISVGENLQDTPQKILSKKNHSIYNKARQMRWEIFLLIQDCIGLTGNWKSRQLDNFVAEFQPDLIFGPLGRVPTPNMVIAYLHRKFKVPVIAYPWDDHYSLKKLSFSPAFWIRTFLERHAIRACADCCTFLYTITEEMQNEYRAFFHKECHLLYKAYDFARKVPARESVGQPIRIVYMGNIGAGRWQIIAKVAKALHTINENGQKAELFIYTSTLVSGNVQRRLNIEKTSHLLKAVPHTEVMRIMQTADILLYVVPVKLKERLQERLSFSTKIVDYFYSAKCILAVGGRTASMKYLIKNDAAITVTDCREIRKRLESLLSHPESIREYGIKAWNCGVKNHQRSVIQARLLRDFNQTAKQNRR